MLSDSLSISLSIETRLFALSFFLCKRRRRDDERTRLSSVCFVVHLKRAPYKKVEFSFPKEGEKEEKIDCKNPKLKSTVKP